MDMFMVLIGTPKTRVAGTPAAVLVRYQSFRLDFGNMSGTFSTHSTVYHLIFNLNKMQLVWLPGHNIICEKPPVSFPNTAHEINIGFPSHGIDSA
jgi:hypothetical protein